MPCKCEIVRQSVWPSGETATLGWMRCCRRPRGTVTLELATLDADDWPIAREVRLRALKDSPSAYISEYEDEVAVGEDGWRERFTRMRWIVARQQARVIGLASSVRVDGRPPYERHVESV